MTEQEHNYDGNSIQVLKGLDAVRKRPGMYIGDTDDGSGLHHMVFEVVDNSIDEALAGYCKNIKVVIHEDGSVSIADDGRGIPVDIHKGEGVSSAEVILTVLHAGGKFNNSNYKHSGGLHGVGVSVVNALSSRLELQIHRNGRIWEQSYVHGVPQAPLKDVADTDRTGTTIRFWPSAETFTNTEFKYSILSTRLRELSFLNSGLKIDIHDERDGSKDNYFYEGGLIAYVKCLNENKENITPDIIYFQHEDKASNIVVEVAMQWNTGYAEKVNCFTNNIPQKDGGTHLAGFRSALTRTITSYIEKYVATKSKVAKNLKFEGEDTREGLVAILSVKVSDPKFSSQTKEKLVSSEVRGVVEATVNEFLGTFFEENPKVAAAICEKVIQAASTRESARKARELSRASKKNTFTTTKLVHCNSNKAEECEVYLVEGDSAGGSAVKARDVQTQAILPLRGKILNVEKSRLEKVIESQEIANIIAVLKCGIGENEFDISNLRYHKIVIMTDADVDGSHIRTLLLTFFYRHMPQLIEAGKVYIAQPPLYKLTLDRKAIYLKNNEEYNKFLIDYALEGATLEINGQSQDSTKLKEVCDKYILLDSLLQSHSRKYSYEVMQRLINYAPLTKETITNQQSMQAWIHGVVSLLTRTSDQSIRYQATEMFDATTGDYNYQLEEIKHGISSTIMINQGFIESRDYREVVRLANEINQLIPRDQEGADIFIVRGESRQKVTYFADVVEYLIKQATAKLKPSRYKGLGEMNWEELEETTMKVENRTLLKVEIQDAIMADNLFTVLMGDDVAPRRSFIEDNALYANVDI